MTDKIASKADKLREMREATYAANHSSGAKGKPQKPAGSKTGDGLARNSSDGEASGAMGYARKQPTMASRPSPPGPSETKLGGRPREGIEAAASKADVSRGKDRPTPPDPSQTNSKRGRPRIGETPAKPWLETKPPMSERTWYRRQKEAKK